MEFTHKCPACTFLGTRHAEDAELSKIVGESVSVVDMYLCRSCVPHPKIVLRFGEDLGAAITFGANCEVGATSETFRLALSLAIEERHDITYDDDADHEVLPYVRQYYADGGKAYHGGEYDPDPEPDSDLDDAKRKLDQFVKDLTDGKIKVGSTGGIADVKEFLKQAIHNALDGEYNVDVVEMNGMDAAMHALGGMFDSGLNIGDSLTPESQKSVGEIVSRADSLLEMLIGRAINKSGGVTIKSTMMMGSLGAASEKRILEMLNSEGSGPDIVTTLTNIGALAVVRSMMRSVLVKEKPNVGPSAN